MIACAGFLTQQYVHVLVDEANPLKAVTALGFGPNLQILSFIGVIELMTWDKVREVARFLLFSQAAMTTGAKARVNILLLVQSVV
jgi:hypothetical protein